MSPEVSGLPAAMLARAGAPADAEALLGLMVRWDLAELGEVDSDIDDALTRLRVTPGNSSALVWSQDDLVGAAFFAGDEGEIFVRPEEVAGLAVETALLNWLGAQAAAAGRRLSIMVAANATDRQIRYAKAGLAHAYSILQYRRPLSDVPKPSWPTGVDVADWSPEQDAREVFALVREAFRDVEGQPDRDWPTWSAQVLDRTDTVVITARDGGDLVGANVMGSFDNYGLVRQLAVPRRQRGRGLGRALLLASFERFAAQGQPEVRLFVYATNRSAVNLYAGAGMTLFTEWQVWARPR